MGAEHIVAQNGLRLSQGYPSELIGSRAMTPPLVDTASGPLVADATGTGARMADQYLFVSDPSRIEVVTPTDCKDLGATAAWTDELLRVLMQDMTKCWPLSRRRRKVDLRGAVVRIIALHGFVTLLHLVYLGRRDVRSTPIRKLVVLRVDADTGSVFWRAYEFDAGCFKGGLDRIQIWNGSFRYVVLSFHSLDCSSTYTA